MIKTILWDFDGVILDSMKIKGDGFIELFKDYDKESLERLKKYHYDNGGVSRFEKIKYFHEKILHKNISESQILEFADKFAKIINKNIFNSSNLIKDSINFIKKNYKKYNFHIVSGAEHNELTNLCKYFELDTYFISINGSPTKKDILVKNVIEKYDYQKEEVILIGDAITDYNAAKTNAIKFYGYNNLELKKFHYIETFDKFLVSKIQWIDENILILKDKFNAKISPKISLGYLNNINIVNPVLSRNIYTSNLFKYFAYYEYDKSIPKQISLMNKMFKILKYYVKSFIYFFFIICHFFTYKLASTKKKYSQTKSVILIDTFTMIDKIYPNGFNDNYFYNILETLERKKKDFIILSILFGDKPYNLRKRYKTYKLLEQSKYNFLSEFELLKISDYFTLLRFIIIYPYYHLNTKKNTKDTFEYLYSIATDETIDSVQVNNYVRYLFGLRLSEYFNAQIKMISWDENQVIHKLLNKGLREKNKKIKIIGTKFFTFAPSWISLENIDVEIKSNVSPDTILIKGKYFHKYYKTNNVKTAFSTRENYLYNMVLTQEKGNSLGVLLGYDIDDSRDIIEYVKNANTTTFDNIIVRLHPNHKLNCPFDIPNNWKIDDGTLIDFSNNCKKIISVGTGAALESMVLGNFLIILGGKNNITTNTLIDELKGLNWDIFYTIEQLNYLLVENKKYDKINIEDYFQEATENVIIKSLEL